MTQTELILLNFTEIRRRSKLLWQALPKEFYGWKPDDSAMTALEMIKHVLQADYGWSMIVSQADMSQYKTPWQGRPLISVADELENTEIIHPGNGEKKMLGQYLLRIGYHESVHAGQFLCYLRAMGVERPKIWD